MSESRLPSRRRLIQAVGAGSAAAALGLQTTSAGAAARGGTATASAAGRLSRVDRAFLDTGLVHGAWVRSGPQDAWTPGPALFRDSGFNAPTFYNPPVFAPRLVGGLGAMPWAVAKGPFGDHLSAPPPAGTPMLSDDMAAEADRLFAMCFGDEENYSEQNVGWLSEYYSRLRAGHPHVLCHNNQWGTQWSDAQLRSYVRAARPDLLTFDDYYFHDNPQFAGGSVTGLYNHTARYRRLALEGPDGTGAAPLGFGQYTCGFRLRLDGASRKYVVSESQQKVVANVTWAMGGRWLTLFRWEDGSASSDGLFLNYADGSATPQFHRLQEINTTMRSWSPYLVRLHTKAIAVARGRTADGSAQSPKSQVADFSETTDRGSWVSGVRSRTSGSANGGQPGDVFFGSFRTQPGLTAPEIGDYLPGPDARAFMIVNALTASNTDPASHTGTGGGGDDTRQEITVTLSTYNAGNYVLHRVQRTDGRPVRVPLTKVSKGVHEFTVSVRGGEGDLFVWL